MRKWLVLFVQAPFVAMMWSACSGDNANGDAGKDVTTVDTAPDKKVTPDVAPGDTNIACGPNAVDPASVTWTKPHAIQPYGCSAQEITDYLGICLDGTNTTQTCAAWGAAHANCYACANSQEGDATFGAAIVTTTSNYIFANTGGCVALLTGDQTATGCGAKEWEATECEDNACATCTVQTDYDTCVAASDTGTCSVFVNAKCSNLDDAGVTACDLNGASFDEIFTAVATVMCGGYAGDAGLPADAGGG